MQQKKKPSENEKQEGEMLTTDRVRQVADEKIEQEALALAKRPGHRHDHDGQLGHRRVKQNLLFRENSNAEQRKEVRKKKKKGECESK